MRESIEQMLAKMSDDEVESAHRKDSWWMLSDAKRKTIRGIRRCMSYGRRDESARMLEENDMSGLLEKLGKLGCVPGIYLRGPGLWRAHVNRAGNHWADASCPYGAMRSAFKGWIKAGCPLDGAADRPDLKVDYPAPHVRTRRARRFFRW